MRSKTKAIMALFLLSFATASQAWWGNNGWGNDWNPYDVWDPRYWIEEMDNEFGNDNWGGGGPWGGPYGGGPWGGPGYYGGPYGGPGYYGGPYGGPYGAPFGPAYGPGPYGPPGYAPQPAPAPAPAPR